jgi:hypothetical protein
MYWYNLQNIYNSETQTTWKKKQEEKVIAAEKKQAISSRSIQYDNLRNSRCFPT